MSLVLGVTVFEEDLRGGWWLLPILLGALLVVAGAFVLVRVPFVRTLVAPDAPR